MSNRYYSNGKLLITGEYLVLDGALSLAVPTKFGQSLSVTSTEEDSITWTALNHQESEWFSTRLKYRDGELSIENTSKSPTDKEATLLNILQQANKLNPGILKNNPGYNITTNLNFPTNWGLGTSSTLINNISQWFNIDPYQLLENTFGGSGYDIAAAQNDNPLTYQLTDSGKSRSVLVSNFDPAFKDRLFFVHLNQKQNSRNSIAHYRSQSQEQLEENVSKVSALTQSIIACTTLAEFELLLEIHETLISKIINTPKIKTQLFPDFTGAVKSLGGWGGDFVLATGGEQERAYFKEKGFKTVLGYEEMVR